MFWGGCVRRICRWVGRVLLGINRDRATNDVRNAIDLLMAKSREAKLSRRESPCVGPQKPTIARYFRSAW